MIDNKRFKEKLAGKIRFPEDMGGKKTLIARVIRSTESHARIKEIKIPDIPENIIVVAAKDIPGKNMISVPGGSIPLLAEKEVLFKGEPILLTAGPDEEQLIEYISTIQIIYEVIPEIQPPENPEDFIAVRDIIKGSPDEIFNQNYQIFKSDFFTASQEHLSTPLLSTFCKNEGQKIIIHCTTQWPYNVLKNITEVTGINKKNIQVISSPAGKSLDSKIWMPTVVACQAAVLTAKSKKPVRLIYTANEDFLSSPKRIPVSFKYKIAVDEKGKLMALDISILLDTGSRMMMTREILDRVCLGSAGIYQCRNIKISGKVFRSNKPPMGAFSGFGLAQAFFASERMASIIATRLIRIQKKEIHKLIDISIENSDEMRLKSARSRSTTDPALWRQDNFLIKGNTFVSSGKLKKDPPLNDLIRMLLKKSDFTRKYAAYSNAFFNRKNVTSTPSGRRGIGMATCYMGSNFLRREKSLNSTSAICRFDKDGKLTIISPTIPGSFLLAKLWKQQAAQILSIDENNIEIITDEENRIPPSGPSTLSRNITITSRLIIQCCEQIKKKRFRETLPIEVKRTFKNNPARKWDTENFSGLPFYELSWAACAVEIEINEWTFIPQVKKIWLTIDCGKLLNKISAISEIERDMMQAIGWCSVESLLLKGDNITEMEMTAYKIPGIYEQPELSIDFLEKYSKNPKGLGGLVLNCIPAAYANAVSLAIGHEFTSLPILPHQIYSAMEEVS